MDQMEKHYNHKESEKKWYKLWEESGFFKPEINPTGTPYTILLPPPNASGKMHTGNILMIAVEDLLIRWRRMKGDAALWIPGTDHAGTETQITFERGLRAEGKSRLNFSRDELYQEIWKFVATNKHNIENQMRDMGASVDWDRYTFTLDDKVLKTVTNTFKKMVGDNLVYRGEYIVNYCPKCGTTYSDVELNHEDRTDPLYFLKYGPFILATVRPETKFGDTAVAVNPEDTRYQEYVGSEIEVEGLLGKFKLKVIADSYVDMEFGTGVVKVTPAHDKNDFEAGLRHNLEVKPVIDMNGKLNERAGKYQGLSVFEGRKKVVEDMQSAGLIDHIDEKYQHTVTLCKAGHEIEPMVIPNWFIKTNDEKISLKKPALEAVTSGKIKIYPSWQEITYVRWLEDMRDWPISRQNVWGIRIPIQYETTDPALLYVWFLNKDGQYQHGSLDQLYQEGASLEEIKSGLQKVMADPKTTWVLDGEEKDGVEYLPETDTFDTWFSSGQWPLVTLGYPDSEDFKKFYPTAVLETGWEIIRLWVSRMVMFGIYLTGDVPFKDVYLHGMVRALDGRKMSKSLGNVINPEEYMEEFGVDALRVGLISGTANGKDFAFPRDRVIAYKNFGNKLWNMVRFTLMMKESFAREIPEFDNLDKSSLKDSDKSILENLNILIKEVDEEITKYRFADGAEKIYQFMWHEVADKYIEEVKDREDKEVALATLQHILKTGLELLHPFMPFITEELWQKLPHQGESIMVTPYPSPNLVQE